MTKAGYAHYEILADRTGSMGRATDPGRTRAMDAEQGIRKLIAEQGAADGTTTVSLTQFNHVSGKPNVEQVARFAGPADPAITGWSCVPYGGTPLLDAVGTTITATGQALGKMAEDQRPSRVFFIIATDGEENSSQEYSLSQVKDMITHQRDAYGWEFVFIGADIDAFSAAGGMGVDAGSTMQTSTASSGSYLAAYAGTSAALKRARAGGQSVSYTAEERDKASQEKPAK